MQRRAAAIYFVFFLVIGAGAYGYITVVDAQQPHVQLDAPTYTSGETFRLDGQRYTVANVGVEESSGEGGHGGGGGASVVGEITWQNQSARFTGTLEHNASTTYEGESYTVLIANESDVSAFTLREELNVSAILADDPAVQDETVQFQGQPHVVYRENDSLRPLEEYLPAREEITFEQGDTYPYEAESGTVDATVSSITPAGEVTVAWTGVENNSVGLEEGGNVTLGGETYLVHFPSESSVQLSQNFQKYQADQARIDYFHERKNGLWGVAIVSLSAAVILLGAAYLPVKD